MINTYFIGGSPCSGKSSVAEIIANRYGLYYFKVDDYLDKYTELGAKKNLEICMKQKVLSPEQIWMREPIIQCKEELQFYEEIFDFLIDELKSISYEAGIVTEGAAYLPELMKLMNVAQNRYISITPTKDFQMFHYKKREWVPFVLEGCRDKGKAFENWMERDALFADEVRRQCEKENYESLVNDGEASVEELLDVVVKHFGLEE